MEKVIEQTNRLELAIKSAELGIWEWNMQTDEVFWSDAQYWLYGYTPGEVTPSMANSEVVVLPNDLPLVKQAMRDAQSGKSMDISFQVILPSGALRYLSCKGSVYLSDDGQPLKVVGTTRDITADKEHKSRSRAYEAILNSNHDFIAFIDRNYTYEVVNDAYCTIHNLKREDILGKHIAEIWGRDIFEKVQKDRLDRCLAGNFVHIAEWADFESGRKYIDARYYPFSHDNRTPSHIILVARDATQMQETYDALEGSERKLGGILDLALEGIISIDDSKEITLFNRGAEEMFGYKAEEVMGQPLSMLMPGRFHQAHSTHIDQFNSEDISKKWMYTPREIKAKRKSGEEFDIEASISKLELGGKTIMTVVMRDITQRLLDDKALAESERQLQSFHENVQEGVFRTSIDGHWLYANPALLEILQYDSQEELMRDDVQSSYPTRDSRVLWLEKISRDVSIKNMEHQLKRKDGELVWVRENSRLVRDEDGVDLWFEGTVTDITDSKMAEQEIANERERLSSTLRSLSEAVLTTDASGQISLANVAAEKLLGRSFQDMQGRPLSEVVHIKRDMTGRAIYLPLEALLAGQLQSMASQRGLLDRSTGDPVPVTCTITRLEDQAGSGQGLVMVIQDISEKKQLETEMLRAQKLESLGVLAGGLAHDFNNFLMSIMLNVSTAGLFARENPKVLELLGDAEESIKRAKGITQQLMAFTRGGEPMKAEMQVGPLIKEAAKFCVRGTTAQTQFEISANLRPAAIDPGQINQVINNLVINAVQSMPEGGVISVVAKNVTVTAMAPIGKLSAGEYLEISVADQGQGIPSDHIQRIFDPYFTTREQGSGLGLFSVFNIIDKHGGWIKVDSTVAVGTTFKFYIPALEHGDLQDGADTTEVIRGAGNILVMDDDELVLKSLTSLLGSIGYSVQTAPSGEQAIALFDESLTNEHPFKAMIFDLTVPGGMGGEATIAKIRNKGSQVPAIAISGYTNTLTMLEPKSAQFQERLAKPFTLAELSQTLDKIIKSAEPVP